MIGPSGAQATLDHLGSVRRNVRGRMDAFWVPLVVVGSGMVVVGALGLVRVAFFAPAIAGLCLVGTVALTMFFRRRGRTRGLRRAAVPYQLIGLGTAVGGFVVAASVPTRPGDAGPWLLAALGYVGYAWRERNAAVLLVASAFAVAALAAMLALPDLPLGALTVAEGALAVAAGLFMRRGVRPWVIRPAASTTSSTSARDWAS